MQLISWGRSCLVVRWQIWPWNPVASHYCVIVTKC